MNIKINSISVFCGSSEGRDDSFAKLATNVGKVIASKKIRLIYGGAKIGLMGAVADGALMANGQVIGVLPDFMQNKEIAHDHLNELILVKSMHERKMKMHELSDAAIALPGGFGTMDELFELLTWLQLGLHSNPIGVLNHNGFYNDLEKQVIKMHSEGFLNEKHLQCILFDKAIEGLLDKLVNWKCPIEKNWMKRSQT